MKKVMMSAFILASFFAAKAQTGSVLVGGDVNFSSSKVQGSDFKNHSLSLNPYVGYQFNDNWTAGVIASLNSQKQEDGASKNKQSSYGAGPFIRYTQPLSNLFSVYGQLEGLFASYKNKSTIGGVTNVTTQGTGIGVNLFPAVFLNLKNNFGLNFNIGGITYGVSNPKTGSNTNTFNINFGQTASIGVSKNFGGKK
jgi:hypothetical protein